MTTYTPTTWENEAPSTTPVKYAITDDTAGEIAASATIELVTSVDAGTAVNATNLNHIETGLETAASEVTAVQAQADDLQDQVTAVQAQADAGAPKIFTAKGDLIAATGNNAAARLAVGTNGQTLMADSAQASGMRWSDGVPGIYTTKGDLSVGTGADTHVRLPAGTNGQLLSADSTQASGLKWVTYANVAARATINGKSVATATYTNVGCDTKTFDTHTRVTTGASFRFTADRDGIYDVKAHAGFASTAWTAGEVALLSLYKNNSFYNSFGKWDCQAAITTAIELGGSDLVQLAAGDYIDVRVYQNSGGSVVVGSQVAIAMTGKG